MPGAFTVQTIGKGALMLSNLLSNSIFKIKQELAIDIEKCAECGGKLRVIACIEDPLLIRQILSHVQQRDGPADFDARGPPGEAIVA